MARELIRGYNLKGEQTQWEIDFDGTSWNTPLFTVRRGTTVTFNRGVVQKTARLQRDASERLGHEIMIGALLWRRLSARRYPAELAELLGFNREGEPAFLLASSRGRPASELQAPLDGEELQAFAVSLFEALRYLEYAGIVHADIKPENILWDGDTVQLVDFSHALERFRPRQRVGTEPWTSPEQREGVGGADIRDDVYSAALVLLHLATGAVVSGEEQVEELLGQTSEELRKVLENAFGPVDGRPDPVELLARLKRPDPCMPATISFDPDARFKVGKEEFERLLERKRAARDQLMGTPLASDPSTRLWSQLWSRPVEERTRIAIAAAVLGVLLILILWAVVSSVVHWAAGVLASL